MFWAMFSSLKALRRRLELYDIVVFLIWRKELVLYEFSKRFFWIEREIRSDQREIWYCAESNRKKDSICMMREILSMLKKIYFLDVLERLMFLMLDDSVLRLIWFNCYWCRKSKRYVWCFVSWCLICLMFLYLMIYF